ncbi:MAG: sensor histidine kinase [Verrucomicrobiales bacterium]|nr:sensor histidine kinase [Verrucomicrobiales bacterium]
MDSGINLASILDPLEHPDRANQVESLTALCHQLRALFARSNAVLERERLLVARRLHDDFAQKLTAASIELCLLDDLLAEANAARCSPAEVRKRVKTVASLLKLMIKATCKLTVELRPKILEELGLAAAIQWHVQQFEAHTEMECHFISEPDEIRIDAHRSTEIFRIVQELLLNVVRHANASKVYVGLRYERGELTVQVQDDGCGISDEDVSSTDSLGLAGIRERIHLLGGEFKINGIPADGTLALVRVPTVQPDGLAVANRILHEVC